MRCICRGGNKYEINPPPNILAGIAVQVLVEGAFTAIKGFPVILAAEQSDGQVQVGDPLSLDALFVFSESALELGSGLRGVLQGLQKNAPVSLIQGESFVIADHLIGCAKGSP